MLLYDVSYWYVTDDPLGDDIERLDAMLNASYEIAKFGPEALDDTNTQTAHESYRFADKEVTVEEKHSHVQQWLDGIGTDNTENAGPSTCEINHNQSLVPLLQLLLAKGVLDEVRPHLPASLQREVDTLCHQPATIQEDINIPCDRNAVLCTLVNEKQDSMKGSKDNVDNIIIATHNCQTNEEIVVAEKELVTKLNNTETKQGHQRDSNLNDNKSLFMDASTNIMHAESRVADKHKISKDNSLIQYSIDSPPLPRECQVMSEKLIEKNAIKLKHYSKSNPAGLTGETNQSFADLVPASSRNIQHTTPCFHQGPKRLLKPIMVCLGCAPHPDGIILTSRNYLSMLQSDEHTCPFHNRLLDKYFSSVHLQKNHCTVELSIQPDNTDALIDCDDIQPDNTLIDHNAVTDHGSTQPLHQGLSCIDEGKAKHGEMASSKPALQDVTNANALSVFNYQTPVKQEPRPTQLINVKVSTQLST